MSAGSRTSSRNTKVHTLCDPWFGKKGSDFERLFWPDFTAALGGESDEFCTLAKHLRGTDPGNVPRSTPAQLAANPQHVNAGIPHAGTAPQVLKSMNAFDARAEKVVALLRSHVEVPALRVEIDRMMEQFEAEDPANPGPICHPVMHAGQLQYPAWHLFAGGALSADDLAAYQQNGPSPRRGHDLQSWYYCKQWLKGTLL